MTRTAFFAALLALNATLLSGCVMDEWMGNNTGPRRICEDCTPANMGGSGFALPQNGVVIYQGTVKVFDLDRRTFSFIETDPPLVRPRAAQIVQRRDAPLVDADLTWATRMANGAWSPATKSVNRGCASNDGRPPALVVLIDKGQFFADRECGPEDAGGQLAELTARADRIVAQRYPGATPK